MTTPVDNPTATGADARIAAMLRDDAPAHDFTCVACGIDRWALQRKADHGHNLTRAEEACWKNTCGRREAWARQAEVSA